MFDAMMKATAAYEVLSDVHRRSAYDDQEAFLRRKAALGRSPSPEPAETKKARIAERVRQRLMAEEEHARKSRRGKSPRAANASRKRHRSTSSDESSGPETRRRIQGWPSDLPHPEQRQDVQRSKADAGWGLPPDVTYSKRWLCIPGYPHQALPRLLPKARRFHKERGTYHEKVVTVAYDRMKERFPELPPRQGR